MTDEKDVLVVMADEDHVRVIPPAEDDSPIVAEYKMFLLAALHRRRLDPEFDADMVKWLMTMTRRDMVLPKKRKH